MNKNIPISVQSMHFQPKTFLKSMQAICVQHKTFSNQKEDSAHTALLFKINLKYIFLHAQDPPHQCTNTFP